MKAAPFLYTRPRDLAEALEVLAAHAADAKVLAGGQSLLPSMAMRLAQPEVVVDVNRVTEMGTVTVLGDTVSLGGLVRHRDLERLAGDHPVDRVLRQAARHIGHLPVRVRGTLGGSLAHADPAAEWPVVMLALGATFSLRSASAQRTVAAPDFFTGAFSTALADDELVVSAQVPLAVTHCGFAEVSRRPGDFAVALGAVALEVRDGTVSAARVAVGGMAGGPARCPTAEAALSGRALDTLDPEAVAAAARGDRSAYDDVHSSAAYKLAMAEVAVADATRRALGGAPGTGERGGTGSR